MRPTPHASIPAGAEPVHASPPNAGPAPAPVDGADLDFGRLLKPVRQRLGRLLLVWALFALLITAALLARRPSFDAVGSVYIDQSDTPQLGEDISALLGGAAGEANIESHVEILRSQRLALKVIRDLGLNARLTGPAEVLPPRPRYVQWLIDPVRPDAYDRGLRVTHVRVDPDVYEEQQYRLRFDSAETFQLLPAAESTSKDPDAASPEALATGRLGDAVEAPGVSFTLSWRGDGVGGLARGLELSLAIAPAEAVLPEFEEALSVTKVGGRSTMSSNVVAVRASMDSPVLAARVSGALIEEYVRLQHGWATSESRKTRQFIEQQLAELRDEMDRAAKELAAYQRESGLVSLSDQLRGELERMTEYEIELAEQRIRLHEVRRLDTQLSRGEADEHLIAFIQDPLIEQMGSRLSELNSRIAALRLDFNADYPPLRDLIISRDSLLSDMRSAVTNQIDRLEDHIAQLEEQVAEFEQRMELMPEQARALTEFVRTTDVFDDLYLFLTRELHRNRIAEESTLTNIQPLDDPTPPLEPSGPGLTKPVLGGLAGGGVLAFLLIAVPALRVRHFADPDEVAEQVAKPVFTVVPHRGRSFTRSSTDILDQRDNSAFLESMRLLRTNLLHSMAGKPHQVVLISGAEASDGKTSISSNLAAALARSQRVKRLILIDADMHHPSLHGVFGLRQAPGLSDYLNGELEIEDVVRTVELHDGARLDVITAGPVPPAPGDLVEAERMARLMTHVRDRYTFTIVDTPPYPLVATASTLAAASDRVLSVCRIGKTHQTLFRRHVAELAALQTPLGLVINDTRARGTGYGYGYGYGKQRYGYGQGKPNGHGVKTADRKPRLVESNGRDAASSRRVPDASDREPVGQAAGRSIED